MICGEDPFRRRPGTSTARQNDKRGASEWREIWPIGLRNEGRSPKSVHRMAAEGMRSSWRWNGGTISPNLGIIWEMSVEAGTELAVARRAHKEIIIRLNTLVTICSKPRPLPAVQGENPYTSKGKSVFVQGKTRIKRIRLEY